MTKDNNLLSKLFSLNTGFYMENNEIIFDLGKKQDVIWKGGYQKTILSLWDLDKEDWVWEIYVDDIKEINILNVTKHREIYITQNNNEVVSFKLRGLV